MTNWNFEEFLSKEVQLYRIFLHNDATRKLYTFLFKQIILKVVYVL
jgi:hypothetical protein